MRHFTKSVVLAALATMMISAPCGAQTQKAVCGAKKLSASCCDKQKCADSTFSNPVWNMAAPDPCVIKAGDGYFYAYSTQGISPDRKMNNIQVLRSRDLVKWEHMGDALPVKPRWAQTTQNFWAPHVTENNGKYYMYFSAEPDSIYKKGKDLSLALAVAVADNPAGPFVEKGEPMIMGDTFINIDPMAFKDPKSGKWYMYWGSGFEPLKVRELSDDLLSFREGAPTTEIIKAFQDSYQFLVEGSWVIYREPYYYIFYSGDNCCGERAHYAVMVARSKSPTGPFEVYCKEKEGDLAILEAGGRWVAPGHNSIIQDDNGTDWIVYHAIDKNDWWMYPEEKKEDKRIILIDPLVYKNGWPEVKARQPSDSPILKPCFKPCKKGCAKTCDKSCKKDCAKSCDKSCKQACAKACAKSCTKACAKGGNQGKAKKAFNKSSNKKK